MESSVDVVSRQLSTTGVDLLLSRVLSLTSGTETAKVVERLYSTHNLQLAWNIGDCVRGPLTSIVKFGHVKLCQLLLLTLPGTPVFSYGDEIGLNAKVRGCKVYDLRMWMFFEDAEHLVFFFFPPQFRVKNTQI